MLETWPTHSAQLQVIFALLSSLLYQNILRCISFNKTESRKYWLIFLEVTEFWLSWILDVRNILFRSEAKIGSRIAHARGYLNILLLDIRDTTSYSGTQHMNTVLSIHKSMLWFRIFYTQTLPFFVTRRDQSHGLIILCEDLYASNTSEINFSWLIQ